MPKSSPVEYALNIVDILNNIASSSENDIVPLDLSYIASSINKLRKGKMKTEPGTVKNALPRLIGRRFGSYILQLTPGHLYFLKKEDPYGTYAGLGKKYNLEFPESKISFKEENGTVKMQAEIKIKDDKQLSFLSKEWLNFAIYLQKKIKEKEE